MTIDHITNDLTLQPFSTHHSDSDYVSIPNGLDFKMRKICTYKIKS